MKILILLLIALISGCSANRKDSQDSGALNNQLANSTIPVPATDGTLALKFDAQISGHGSSYVGALSIHGGVGSIELAGVKLPVVAYSKDWFPAANRTGYTILSAQKNLWAVFFAYCDNSGNLTDIWYETTNGAPTTREAATGSCTGIATATAPRVNFPAASLPVPKLVSGFSLRGKDLNYDGHTPGTLNVAGSHFIVYPFVSVDCSTGCGYPGARELHSILWEPTKQVACFGIFDLGVTPGYVDLTLMLCLPRLVVVPIAMFPATYTTPY